MRKKNVALLGVLFSLPIICLMAGAILVMGLNAGRNSTASRYETFASCAELADWVQAPERYYYPMPVEDSISGKMDAGATAEVDYSVTNVQVAGVDESDVIKTNGKHIFLLSGEYVYVLDADAAGDLTDYVHRWEVGWGATALFLNGDKLVVFGNKPQLYDVKYTPDYEGVASDLAYYSSEYTAIEIYDVKTVTNPKLERQLVVEGTYISARMINDTVYLVANYYLGWGDEVTSDSVSAYIPEWADYRGSGTIPQGEFSSMASCEEVGYFGESGTSFTVMASVNIADPDSIPTSKVVAGPATTVYMSHGSLYLAGVDYALYEEPTLDPLCLLMGSCPTPVVTDTDYKTTILQVNLKDDGFEFGGLGEIEGTLLNQFSIDEHSGYLRAVTTETGVAPDYIPTNSVYVLNGESLEVEGELTGLAPTETVYSARFIGDRVYLVTYRNIDPLFVIDLSSPTTPQVLGELKIPGYSNYLHPYGSNRLIGFGIDSEETTRETRQLGLKIAIFNVEDPTNPEEEGKLTMGGRGSTSQVLYDHKALMFDEDNGLIVIPVSLMKEGVEDWSYETEFTGFALLKVKAGEIVEVVRIPTAFDTSYISSRYYSSRALYVGDNLFLTDGYEVVKLDLGDYSELGRIILE